MSDLVYWEIPSTDLDASVRFYSELFAWRIEPSLDNYYSFSSGSGDSDDGGAGIGGGISLVERMSDVCIEVYIGVDDITATLARVEELGGKIVREKVEIGNDYGYMAFFTDPCGCRIGLWSRS